MPWRCLQHYPEIKVTDYVGLVTTLIQASIMVFDDYLGILSFGMDFSW